MRGVVFAAANEISVGSFGASVDVAWLFTIKGALHIYRCVQHEKGSVNYSEHPFRGDLDSVETAFELAISDSEIDT
jgi:hypothetical protein